MFRTIILLSVAGAALANAGFDCAKYQTECVDTEITAAYDSCDAVVAANTDESMKCRIEHLGYITAGDDATRDQHCSHAAEVAVAPCADETLLKPILAATDFQKYPDYAGTLVVGGTVGPMTTEGTTQTFDYSLTGTDPACSSGAGTAANSCGVHIHSGITCNAAADVGGHFYTGTVTEDPWKTSAYTSDDTGAASDTDVTVDTGATAYQATGKAMVIHDHTGARIACTLLAEAPAAAQTGVATADAAEDTDSAQTGGANFDCAKYKTECVGSGKTAAYAGSCTGAGCDVMCDEIAGENTDESMKCRIEHLGYIKAGDETSRDQHCSHAAEVADGPCKDETLKDSPPPSSPPPSPPPSPSSGPGGDCPIDVSTCSSEKAVECGKECTTCLADPAGTTTSGKACSTCESCIAYAPCAGPNCGGQDNSALGFTAAMTGLGLNPAEIEGLMAVLEGLPEGSPITLMLDAAFQAAFGDIAKFVGEPTVVQITAVFTNIFTSAEFRTELKDTDGIDADLLAAVSTASENANESGAAGLALNLAVVAMAAAALL